MNPTRDMVSFLRIPCSRLTITFISGPVSILPFMTQSSSPARTRSATFWAASTGSGTWMISAPAGSKSSSFKIWQIFSSSPTSTGSTNPSRAAITTASRVCSSWAAATPIFRLTGKAKSRSFTSSNDFTMIYAS